MPQEPRFRSALRRRGNVQLNDPASSSVFRCTSDRRTPDYGIAVPFSPKSCMFWLRAMFQNDSSLEAPLTSSCEVGLGAFRFLGGKSHDEDSSQEGIRFRRKHFTSLDSKPIRGLR